MFKFSNFAVYLIIKGLSDHDAQSLILHKILVQNTNTHFYYNRKIDKLAVIDFNTKVSYESWEDIFTENDVNTIFNKFLNMYLRIFHSCFPLKKVHHKSCRKAWITLGIKTSCINKNRLFLIQRNSNDPNLSKYYKKYCRILTNVIKLAKKRYYNNIITCSKNKTKTTWNIIKLTSNIKPNSQNITPINIDGSESFNGQTTADTFSKYFASVAQNIHVNNHNANPPSNNENPIT